MSVCTEGVFVCGFQSYSCKQIHFLNVMGFIAIIIIIIIIIIIRYGSLVTGLFCLVLLLNQR